MLPKGPLDLLHLSNLACPAHHLPASHNPPTAQANIQTKTTWGDRQVSVSVKLCYLAKTENQAATTNDAKH
jgi:hypothetical protein